MVFDFGAIGKVFTQFARGSGPAAKGEYVPNDKKIIGEAPALPPGFEPAPEPTLITRMPKVEVAKMDLNGRTPMRW